MRVTVMLFGHYRDLMPEQTILETPDGSTVGDLAAGLAARDKRLAGISEHCRVAVNEEYVDYASLLADGDEVAFIPPMSGG